MKPEDLTDEPRDAVIALDTGDSVRTDTYGRRAADLARLTSLGLPVPAGVALSFSCTALLATGGPMPVVRTGEGRLYVLRASPKERSWGGASAILGVGASAATYEVLRAQIGRTAAFSLHRRAITGLAQLVHGIDPAAFDGIGLEDGFTALAACFEEETGHPWPEDAAAQLEAGARAMARRWGGASSRVLRTARGAPEDAGLGLVVQEMVVALAPGLSGTCQLQLVEGRTGAPRVAGVFVDRAALAAGTRPAGRMQVLTAFCPPVCSTGSLRPRGGRPLASAMPAGSIS